MADAEHMIIDDRFEESGDLPDGWTLTGDDISDDSERFIAGIGGNMDSTGVPCLHLIQFKGQCKNLGLLRKISVSEDTRVSIAFDLALLYPGMNQKPAPGDKKNSSFHILVQNAQNQPIVCVNMDMETRRLYVNESDTQQVLPGLNWHALQIVLDPSAGAVTVSLDERTVYQGTLAGSEKNGIEGVRFLLPENEAAHVGLWVNHFRVCAGTAASCAPAGRQNPMEDSSAVDTEKNADVRSLELNRVQAQGHMGKRIRLALYRNMMALDTENDFIAPFTRQETQDESERVEMEPGKFIGIGMLLDAAVQMACYADDPELVRHKDRLAEAAMRMQQENGYIGVYPCTPEASPLFTEFCFHDAVYLVLGLARNFELFDHSPSLDCARKLAGYIMDVWPDRPAEPVFTTLGINEAFLLLASATGDPIYLDFIRNQKSGKQWVVQNQSLLGWDQELWKGGHPDRNRRSGGPAAERHAIIHAYRLYERAMAQLRVNAVESDDRLTQMPFRIAQRISDPQATGMLITGASGNNEGWEDTQLCTGNTGETCTTVYGIWYMEEMLKYTGDLRYGDYIERMIYNSLFCAQQPEGRKLRYFSPPSGERKYYDRDSYCCPNNFRRGMARLAEQIYYQYNTGLAVNFFEDSRAEIRVSGDAQVTLRQTTAYPAEDTSRIEIEDITRETEFPVHIRIPAWCTDSTVMVNGEPVSPVIQRTWKKGDTIDIHLPMAWRMVRGRELQQDRAAVMRGPVVYCLSRQLNHLPEDMVLRDITMDPQTLETQQADDRGVLNKPICRIQAWSPGCSQSEPYDLTLLLHEFPEPTGEEVYFNTSEPSLAQDDELFMKK